MPPAPILEGAPGAFVDALLGWLRAAGSRRYDEDVTQLEHALQCAELARLEHAEDGLVLAALLHDVGHLLIGPDVPRGADLRHEDAGARWLEPLFGDEVAGTVRLHVGAKRWLCAMDPAYEGGLSRASIASLRVQGGPMTADERGAFELEPNREAAVRLRRWDDRAKDPYARVPDLEAYGEVLLAGLSSPGTSARAPRPAAD